MIYLVFLIGRILASARAQILPQFGTQQPISQFGFSNQAAGLFSSSFAGGAVTGFNPQVGGSVNAFSGARPNLLDSLTTGLAGLGNSFNSQDLRSTIAQLGQQFGQTLQNGQRPLLSQSGQGQFGQQLQTLTSQLTQGQSLNSLLQQVRPLFSNLQSQPGFQQLTNELRQLGRSFPVLPSFQQQFSQG